MIVVAKREFLQAIRSRTLLGLTALFVVFVVGGVLVTTQLPEAIRSGVSEGTLGVVLGLLTPASLFVPIIGLLASYNSIAGEREDGTIYHLLAVPRTRMAVFFGKFLGRTAVVWIAVLVGFLAGAAAIFGTIGSLSVGAYASFVGSTLLLGTVSVGLGIGISALTASRTRAAWVAFGAVAVFQFVWGLVGFAAFRLIEGGTPQQPPLPGWYIGYSVANPQNAYYLGVIGALPADTNVGQLPTLIAGDAAAGLIGTGSSVVILLVWTLLPLTVGYLRFQRADL